MRNNPFCPNFSSKLAIQTPFREVLVKCGIIRFVLIFLVNLPKGSMKKLANGKVLMWLIL